MKKIVLIYQELKALGIIGAAQFKTHNVRLLKIEMKFNGKGYVLVTNDKTISENGRFNVTNSQMMSIISVATATQLVNGKLSPSVVRHFIKSINTTADTSKTQLVLTFHDTIVNHEVLATADMTAINPQLTAGDKFSISEGWENQLDATRTAFNSKTRVNTYSVEPSDAAESAFDDKRQAIDIAVSVEETRIAATSVAKPSTQSANKVATVVVDEPETIVEP